MIVFLVDSIVYWFQSQEKVHVIYNKALRYKKKKLVSIVMDNNIYYGIISVCYTSQIKIKRYQQSNKFIIIRLNQE